MTLAGTYVGTLDRVTEGVAVFLIEDSDATTGEHRIAADELPDDASEGDVCRLTFEDGKLVGIEPQPDATAARRRRLRERFDDLSSRLDGT